MPLTADQRAMLQLLLERGQSYADLAAVLDISEDDVRSRARGALTELGGTDPDEHVGLTDYVLGQADPIGRADAVRHLKDSPADMRLVEEIAAKLRLIAPEAELPRLPGEPRQPRPRRQLPRVPRPPASVMQRVPFRRRAKAPAESGTEEGAPAAERTLSHRQTRLMVAIGSGAVLLIVGILAVSGAFSGGSSSSEAGTTASATEQPAIKVPLQPTAMAKNASGTAVFSQATGGQPEVELALNGLPQPPNGQAYIAWLLLNDKQGHPLSPVNVDANGAYDQRIPLQSFQVPIAQKARFIDVSVSDATSLNTELQDALKKRTPIIPYQGKSALRGTIPGSSQK